jgi:hypothetical protein
LRSVDPDRLDDMDAFELGESIQEILKENGFPVIKSEFPDMPEGYLEAKEAQEAKNVEEN